MRVLDLRRPPPWLALEAVGRAPVVIETAHYHAELSARWPGYDLLTDYPGYRVMHGSREVAALVHGGDGAPPDTDADTLTTAEVTRG